ncbi:hypothetical protein GQX74_011308 [Glossina fuscipes]|nr:hypothetical protein GQX74_011308 [Glossina fuscipes]
MELLTISIMSSNLCKTGISENCHWDEDDNDIFASISSQIYFKNLVLRETNYVALGEQAELGEDHATFPLDGDGEYALVLKFCEIGRLDSDHNPVLINELKMSDFKQVFMRQNNNSEFPRARNTNTICTQMTALYHNSSLAFIQFALESKSAEESRKCKKKFDGPDAVIIVATATVVVLVGKATLLTSQLNYDKHVSALPKSAELEAQTIFSNLQEVYKESALVEADSSRPGE